MAYGGELGRSFQNRTPTVVPEANASSKFKSSSLSSSANLFRLAAHCRLWSYCPWLFGVDVAIVAGSIPIKSCLEASIVGKLRWSNSGGIPNLKHESPISQGYSRKVNMKSDNEQVQFFFHLVLTLNRTELSNINGSFPVPKSVLMDCNNSEVWHIVCQCDERLFEYDLSLQLTRGPDEPNGTLYVPTDGISVITGPNKIIEGASKSSLTLTCQ